TWGPTRPIPLQSTRAKTWLQNRAAAPASAALAGAAARFLQPLLTGSEPQPRQAGKAFARLYLCQGLTASPHIPILSYRPLGGAPHAHRGPPPSWDAMIITIDGPAGAGKSSAARALARHLGFEFLDTGAMYRAVALLALRAGINLTDE